VADLIGAGLVKNVPNALGKTVFGYEKVTDMDAATTSLDGISRTNNDRQEFELNQLPLPITHKDFFINLRTLAASREKGESLRHHAGRSRAEWSRSSSEKMLFQGGPKFGGLPIYGYMTHPERVTSPGFGTVATGADGEDGRRTSDDTLTMMTALQANRMYGPVLDLRADRRGRPDRERLQGERFIQTIRSVWKRSRASSCGARCGSAADLQRRDGAGDAGRVVSWVNGENLQTVQWDEYGGFEVNFKAFAIGVPLIRSDIAGRSGRLGRGAIRHPSHRARARGRHA
jgi:hypothetical protein